MTTQNTIIDPSAIDLHYTTDEDPGIRRRRAGTGFAYIGIDGKTITEEEEKARIHALAIPPAWTDVWISTDPLGHLQATGRDSKGRKQYIYHDLWDHLRDANKFHHMLGFGRALPRLRDTVSADIRRPGLPREKVLAAIVRILETTWMRIGSEHYADENHTYGIATLHGRHVEHRKNVLRFRFPGKNRKVQVVGVHDPRVEAVVRACQDLPGQRLFEYIDDNDVVREVESSDVNRYIRQAAGGAFSAKDFRTWAATVYAYSLLVDVEPPESAQDAQKKVKAAMEEVAARLGNTATVCRTSYVHPLIVESFTNGQLGKVQAIRTGALGADGLWPEERAAMQFLESRLSRGAVKTSS